MLTYTYSILVFFLLEKVLLFRIRSLSKFIVEERIKCSGIALIFGFIISTKKEISFHSSSVGFSFRIGKEEEVLISLLYFL